jgi:Protein of unknown function (DUF2846)
VQAIFTRGLGSMFSMLRAAAAALICALLAACAATSALESQSKPASAQSARIYVVRPLAFAGGATAAHIKINDAEVGSVANNSYLFVDRPPGRYRIQVSKWGEPVNSEHEFQVEAGRTYYFAFNAPAATMALPGGGVMMTPGAGGGRQVGQASLFSGHLAELDAAAGAQVVARMKAQQR